MNFLFLYMMISMCMWQIIYADCDDPNGIQAAT